MLYAQLKLTNGCKLASTSRVQHRILLSLHGERAPMYIPNSVTDDAVSSNEIIYPFDFSFTANQLSFDGLSETCQR